MSDASDIAVIARLKQAAIKLAAMNPGLVDALLHTGTGLVGGGILGAALMKAHQDDALKEELARNRKLDFGAGVATGAGVPIVGRALYQFLGRED